jgi:hypothetical protein
LLRESRLLRFDDESLRRRGASEAEVVESALRLRGAIVELAILWHNNLRYSCEDSLRAFLKRRGKLRGVKGDPPEEERQGRARGGANGGRPGSGLMDLREKIAKILSRSLGDVAVRLEDDDGITGYAVSDRFRGMPSLDRQRLIDSLLRQGPEPLSDAEQRRVLMIATLTPVEFDSIGARIRVQKLRTKAGRVEVLLHGRAADAEYLRDVLGRGGVKTTDPKQSRDAPGILMTIRAEGEGSAPLTKEKVARILGGDPYVEVLPGA